MLEAIICTMIFLRMAQTRSQIMLESATLAKARPTSMDVGCDVIVTTVVMGSGRQTIFMGIKDKLHLGVILDPGRRKKSSGFI